MRSFNWLNVPFHTSLSENTNVNDSLSLLEEKSRDGWMDASLRKGEEKKKKKQTNKKKRKTTRKENEDGATFENRHRDIEIDEKNNDVNEY